MDEDKGRVVILDTLRGGPLRKLHLQMALIKLGVSCEDRPLDRLLQKMREEGFIRFTSGKWHLTTRKVCSTCEGKGWVDETKA